MDEIDIETSGSRVRFDGKLVTIDRVSGTAKSVFGARSTSLSVDRISGVELVAATRFRSGHIRFAVPGAQGSAAPTAPNRDEHAVLFGRAQGKEFALLADAVRAALSR